ncbi:MAG: hypothetical protein FJY85_23860, partial [Deltaproteobacteria bacterium]|nr:hypothetical protein [Deltaproteobacteria bacterium]
RGAPDNGFHKLFFPYDVRPGRNQEWYDKTRASIPPDLLEGLTPDLYMEQNYPRTEEEALAPTQTMAAVDLKVLEQMKSRCFAPISVKGDFDPLLCKVYQDFAVGSTYVAASDTSHGVGKDYNVTVIMDARTGVVVADIINNFQKPDDFAWHSVKLLNYFRNPKWFPEDNDWGAALISKARELHYPNFGYQDEKRTKIGYHSHATRTEAFWDTLVAAFNNFQISIPSYQGLLQFGDLIRNMEKGGRIEAIKGRHDDYPLAVGICVFKAAEVLKVGTYSPAPIHTVSFRRQLVRSGR